eukprot:scaffold19205_cov87-Isochrysis_galbana.AAC.1
MRIPSSTDIRNGATESRTSSSPPPRPSWPQSPLPTMSTHPLSPPVSRSALVRLRFAFGAGAASADRFGAEAGPGAAPPKVKPPPLAAGAAAPPNTKPPPAGGAPNVKPPPPADAPPSEPNVNPPPPPPPPPNAAANGLSAGAAGAAAALAASGLTMLP